jgi:hypothetical protein
LRSRRSTGARVASSTRARGSSSAGTAPQIDDRLFVSHLIDLVTAVLAAPVSGETLRLADDRDSVRSSGGSGPAYY